jgi:hypothetical protein
MDQLSAARISRGALKQLGYDIPIPIERQHPQAMRVIQTAKAILLEADDRTHQVFDDPAWKEIATKESDLALARLWESLKSAKRLYSDRRRRKPDQEKKQNVGQIISALRRHLHRVRFPYLYGAGPDKTSIMGGGVLLPPRETVVLDATGTFNNVYRELADEYVVTELPKVRDYSEVTLHVELTNEGTGNATATQKPETLAKATLDAVVKYYGADAAQHRVLAVSHKNAEPAFKSYGEGAGFAAFDAAHYGAIDGRNTWSDFDTLIVPTLLYADPATAFLEYQELRQRQLSTDELNAPPDGVMLMQETHVVSALAQAMGRIRLRRVVDAAGRCEPCDVFARLPAGARMVESQRLLEALRDALPGLVVKYDWSAGSLGPRAKNYVPGSAYAETYGPLFIRAILGLEPGERMDVAEVRRIVALTAIGLVTDRTWDRVMKDAQTSGTQLQVLLQTAGGQVERVRRGRVWALELVRGATLSFPSIERK